MVKFTGIAAILQPSVVRFMLYLQHIPSIHNRSVFSVLNSKLFQDRKLRGNNTTIQVAENNKKKLNNLLNIVDT